MQCAAEKLRAQHSLCKKIRTGMFNPEEAHYANGALVELPYGELIPIPSCDH